MSRDQQLDDNDLRALRSVDREAAGATFESRTRVERAARVRADARRDRPSTPSVQINFAGSPELKQRLVQLCKANDMRIVDFMRDAITKALDELEGK